MAQPVVVVDSFAERPFAGNPAAVCVLESAADETWMQNVAREMNLSETAFLYPRLGGSWHLRWFTPVAEVDLCGHATLASAHVLWETARLGPTEIASFETRSGMLTAERQGDEWIRMDFPATPPEECVPPEGILEALGVKALWVGKSRFDYVVEVESESVVRAVTPDLAVLTHLGARAAMVTARSEDARFDFVSRFFAPGVGVAEDPVTGSAHCALAPFWASKLGKSDLVGYQASARGGVVQVSVQGPRVLLGGRAITMMRGELVH